MQTIPERNRAVKALLVEKFGKGNVRVQAGNGTARQWIEIELTTTEPFVSLTYGEQSRQIVAMLEAAGIDYSTLSRRHGRPGPPLRHD